jgi:hypothetical protein
VNDLKATVSSKVGARNDDILRNIEDINQNLRALKISEEVCTPLPKKKVKKQSNAMCSKHKGAHVK